MATTRYHQPQAHIYTAQHSSFQRALEMAAAHTPADSQTIQIHAHRQAVPGAADLWSVTIWVIQTPQDQPIPERSA